MAQLSTLYFVLHSQASTASKLDVISWRWMWDPETRDLSIRTNHREVAPSSRLVRIIITNLVPTKSTPKPQHFLRIFFHTFTPTPELITFIIDYDAHKRLPHAPNAILFGIHAPATFATIRAVCEFRTAPFQFHYGLSE